MHLGYIDEIKIYSGSSVLVVSEPPPISLPFYAKTKIAKPTSRRVIGNAESYLIGMQQLLPLGIAFNKKHEDVVSRSSNVYVYEDGIFDYEDGIGEAL